MCACTASATRKLILRYIHFDQVLASRNTGFAGPQQAHAQHRQPMALDAETVFEGLFEDGWRTAVMLHFGQNNDLHLGFGSEGSDGQDWRQEA